MTIDKLEEAKELHSEIEKLKESADFFDYENHRYLCKSDKERSVDKIKNNKFPFFISGFFKDNKNMAQLNVKGFFGGKTIECDTEFIEMCHSYFKNKLEEKKKTFEQLN